MRNKDITELPIPHLAGVIYLKDDIVGQFFKAIYMYATDGIEIELDNSSSLKLFQDVKRCIDERNLHKKHISDIRSKVGKLGGRPKTETASSVSESPPTIPEMTDLTEQPVNTTEVQEDKPKRKAVRFIKPTLDEIQGYIEEYASEHNKTACFNSQRFYDYYESCGWVVGKSRKPMKNWRAAVRQWFSDGPVYQQTAKGREDVSTKVFKPF